MKGASAHHQVIADLDLMIAGIERPAIDDQVTNHRQGALEVHRPGEIAGKNQASHGAAEPRVEGRTAGGAIVEHEDVVRSGESITAPVHGIRPVTGCSLTIPGDQIDRLVREEKGLDVRVLDREGTAFREFHDDGSIQEAHGIAFVIGEIQCV